uniref:NAD-dependent oxidoreductase n=2 Tax=Methanococcus voltae TaxID=2188 RepID=Q2EMV0_METVO|nr:NAD-dependent oxidoreductase [Methanococcus voltae PS]
MLIGDNMLKVGVIGVGMMGYNHVRIYKELEKSKEKDIKLVGVSDTNEERVNEIAKEFDTKAFTDYKELINEGVDLVSIVVPTFLHKKIASEFIEAGVNVLVEKPIADSIENAKELIALAKKNNVKLAVGHVERFNPAILELKKHIEKGVLGDIVTMTAKRVGPMTSRITDVGVILDLSVHDIDAMHFLCGSKVKDVYAKAKNVKHPSDAEDYALIIASFENNVDGIIETNRLTPHKTRSLSVIGTEGIAYLDYIDQSLTIYDNEWVKKAKIEHSEPLKNELLNVIESVENDVKPLVCGEDGLHALEVALKALKSSK